MGLPSDTRVGRIFRPFFKLDDKPPVVGPSSYETPDIFPAPFAFDLPQSRPIIYSTLRTHVSTVNQTDGWRQIDVSGPTLFCLVAQDMTGGAGSLVSYFQLHAHPAEIPTKELMAAIRACGTRLFLPTRGRWYVTVLCNLDVAVPYALIDAANPALVDLYLRRGSCNASFTSAWTGSQAIAAASTMIFDISAVPEVSRFEVRNTGANPVFVNDGADASATDGQPIAAGATATFEGSNLAPTSFFAFSAAGTTIRTRFMT